MAARNNKYSRNVFAIQSRNEGSRHYYEHDDRGYQRGSGSRGHNRGGYRGGGNYRGHSSGRHWDDAWESEGSNNRLPEGHWRGDSKRIDRRNHGGRSFRNPRAPRNNYDDSGEMIGNRNRRQDMYKGRGGRRARDGRNFASNQNSSYGAAWHKIILRDACHIDKEELLQSIRSFVEEPFTPILYEVDGRSLVFFLEDNWPAVRAIAEISRRLTLPNGRPLSITTTKITPPSRPLTQDQLTKVAQIMSERYNIEGKRLVLENFHNDPNLVKENILCPLYRLANLQAVVNIINTHIPDLHELDLRSNKLHSVEELASLKSTCGNLQILNLQKNRITNTEIFSKLEGMNIMHLSIEGNPVCDKVKDLETLISAVRKYFPKVLYLDGRELPKPIGFEVDEDDSKLPPNLPSYLAVPEAKDVVLKFIDQYYQIFDTENRRPLEAAYTENCLFSLTCSFPENGPGARFVVPYLKENRNIRREKTVEGRQKLLVRGRQNVINKLCKLPSTNHDLLSFTVDISEANPRFVHVTLMGVFQQLVDRSPPVRSFTRNFTIVPEGGGFCICNEMLHIAPATVNQIKKFFKPIPAPGEVAAPQPVIPQDVGSPQAEVVLSPEQVEMIKNFSEASGMLPEYSLECLKQNSWDFHKAGEMFTQLKAENKIPPEYFIQPVASC